MKKEPTKLNELLTKLKSIKGPDDIDLNLIISLNVINRVLNEIILDEDEIITLEKAANLIYDQYRVSTN